MPRKVPAKLKVQLHGQPMRSAVVEDGATRGATFGVDVYDEDGEVLTLAQLVALAAGAVSVPTIAVSATSWPLILDVPPNVEGLAELAAAGLVTRTAAGAIVARSVAEVAGETVVTDGAGDAGNPTVGLADVADAGGGALVKVVFDGKGRRTGTTAVAAADLTPLLDPVYDAIGAAAAAEAEANDYTDLLAAIVAAAGIGETDAVVLTDLNVALGTAPMFFSYAGSTTNAPATNVGAGIHIPVSATAAVQIAMTGNNNSRIYWRSAAGGSYNSWVEIGARNYRENSAANGGFSGSLLNFDLVSRTALSAPCAIGVPSVAPTGHGAQIGFYLKDDGTARAISWDPVWRATTTTTLPTTTVVGKGLWVWFRYNSYDNAYDVQNVMLQA